MADPTSVGVYVVTLAPAAAVATIMGIPVDAIFWAAFGALIMVTRGPRVAWDFWLLAGAVGAFALSFGTGALLGTLAPLVLGHYLSWGLPDQLVRATLAFFTALLAQQIFNRLGVAIERAKLPGDTGAP